MKMRYITGPQSLDIKPEGLNRSMAVEFMMGELMELNALMGKVVYADDMLLSMVPFRERGNFLMCPANAQEEVKDFVRKNNGFISPKRSTEAVAEFLTEVYPKEYKDKHRLVYSIYLDKDGVLWEEERLKENLPFFRVITDHVKNCQGPYTAYPPISIATGAHWESTLKVLNHIKLDRDNIPAMFHRDKAPFAWPPVIFEEGCLAYDPVTGITFDLTEEKYGLFPCGFQRIISSITKLGAEIDKRVSEINKQLGQDCKIVHKEKSGYTLNLPFEVRSSLENLRKAHYVIYQNIRDLLGGNMEFAGLFTKEELEG